MKWVHSEIGNYSQEMTLMFLGKIRYPNFGEKKQACERMLSIKLMILSDSIKQSWQLTIPRDVFHPLVFGILYLKSHPLR
jgi:hypothetical protein